MNGQTMIQSHYDHINDVLYLSLGVPQAALTRTDEEDDRINWRVSFEDRETVVGVTVLDYSLWDKMCLIEFVGRKIHLEIEDLPNT